MTAYLYTFLNVMFQIKDKGMSYLKISYLRSKGAKIGKNCWIGRNSHVYLGKEARLSIGDGVRIDRDTDIIVHERARMEIGSRVYIGKRNILSASKEVILGHDCITAHQVTILDSNHRYQDPCRPISEQGADVDPVHLGSDVWLGAGVTVLSGVKLGSRTIVAANSAVTKSHPEKVILGGVPAIVLRRL